MKPTRIYTPEEFALRMSELLEKVVKSYNATLQEKAEISKSISKNMKLRQMYEKQQKEGKL